MDTAPLPEERLCLDSRDCLAHHKYENCGAPGGMASSDIPPDCVRKFRFDMPLAFLLMHNRCHTSDTRGQRHHDRPHHDHCRTNHVGSALSWLVTWRSIPPNTFQSPPKAATSKFGYALSGSLLPLTLHTESRLPNIRH